MIVPPSASCLFMASQPSMRTHPSVLEVALSSGLYITSHWVTVNPVSPYPGMAFTVPSL